MSPNVADGVTEPTTLSTALPIVAKTENGKSLLTRYSHRKYFVCVCEVIAARARIRALWGHQVRFTLIGLFPEELSSQVSSVYFIFS